MRELVLPNTHKLFCVLQLYEPFYADFGPLNLGKTYRFCEQTKQLLLVGRARPGNQSNPLHSRKIAAIPHHSFLLQEANKLAKKLYLYTGPSPQAKANAAVLVGCYKWHVGCQQ